MKWWIDIYNNIDEKKSKLLYVISVFSLIPFFILTNLLYTVYLTSSKEILETMLYIVMLNISISLFLISFLYRKETWYFKTFHEMTAYGVVDSLFGKGYKIQKWEITLLFFLMLKNYLKYTKWKS
jgi:hypothetical protein